MTRRSPSQRAAFTLIELLVVIGIIGVLIGLTLVVAGRVTENSKVDQTKKTLIALEAVLAEFTSSRGGGTIDARVLDPAWRDGSPRPVRSYYPLVDGMVQLSLGAAQIVNNSAGLFLHAAAQDSSTANKIKGIPSKFLRDYNPIAGGVGFPTLPTPMDAWGRPIRFVHPAFDGVVSGSINAQRVNAAQFRPLAEVLGSLPDATQQDAVADIRRNNIRPTPANDSAYPANVGDADGGVCIGGRAYFYSAGPDGDPATLDDNVYGTVVPKLPGR